MKSFLSTFESIFADSGLHELVQLIYPGPLVADSILNGGSYDKAIRCHFLIDAALVQHAIPSDMFSGEELSQMEATIANMVENKLGSDSQYDPVVKKFQKKIEETFNELKNGGPPPQRTPTFPDISRHFLTFPDAARHFPSLPTFPDGQEMSG